MILQASQARILLPLLHVTRAHTRERTQRRDTQSLTVSMTTSLQLYSYSGFPFVLRDRGDKGVEGGKGANWRLENT